MSLLANPYMFWETGQYEHEKYMKKADNTLSYLYQYAIATLQQMNHAFTTTTWWKKISLLHRHILWEPNPAASMPMRLQTITGTMHKYQHVTEVHCWRKAWSSHMQIQFEQPGEGHMWWITDHKVRSPCTFAYHPYAWTWTPLMYLLPSYFIWYLSTGPSPSHWHL